MESACQHYSSYLSLWFGIVQMFGGKKISTITYHHIKKKIINHKLTNTNPILITKNNMNTHK